MNKIFPLVRSKISNEATLPRIFERLHYEIRSQSLPILDRLLLGPNGVVGRYGNAGIKSGDEF